MMEFDPISVSPFSFFSRASPVRNQTGDASGDEQGFSCDKTMFYYD
jgi:hypothetical protein